MNDENQAFFNSYYPTNQDAVCSVQYHTVWSSEALMSTALTGYLIFKKTAIDSRLLGEFFTLNYLWRQAAMESF